MKKTYILIRSKDYAPTGPFQLGSLLAEPTTPESIIENSGPVPRPTSIPTQTSILTDFKDTHENNDSGKYGIFTKFLSIVGIGADLSYEHSSTNSREINAERLETRFFTPTRAYLETVMQDPAVQTFVKEKRFRANVYVVTGLRLAFGVGVGSESKETKGGVKVTASVSGTLVGGPPVEIGPNVEMGRGEKRNVRWGAGSTDFVYAYRVKEVIYSVTKGKLVSKDIKGDLYSLDGKWMAKEEGKRDGEESFTLEVEEIGPEWETAESMGENVAAVFDEGGELCELVVP